MRRAGDNSTITGDIVSDCATPHSIDAQLIPVTISSSGVPTVTGGSTGQSILQRVKSMSASLGTTVTIQGDRGYVHVKRKPKED